MKFKFKRLLALLMAIMLAIPSFAFAEDAELVLDVDTGSDVVAEDLDLDIEVDDPGELAQEEPTLELGGELQNGDLLEGDLGRSITLQVKQPVTKILSKKIPYSMTFGLGAIAISLVAGCGLGVLMARNQGKMWDHIGTGYIVIINAVPPIVYFLMLQLYLTEIPLLPLLFFVLALIAEGLLGIPESMHRDPLAPSKPLWKLLPMYVLPPLAYYAAMHFGCTAVAQLPMMAAVAGGVIVLIVIVRSVMTRGAFICTPAGHWTAVCAVLPVLFYAIWMQLGADPKHFPMLFDEDKLISYVLPMLCVALGPTANYAMWIRRYMVDEINKDYIKLARAKGMKNNAIMLRHVLRNAFIPLAQYLPSSILYTISGSIYVEALFSIPGTGGLLINSIQKQDNPLVQALVLLYAVCGVGGLLLGDLAMAVCDPRIRLDKTKGGSR
jgi:ABC-type dipeptide/oligopeptide/nickel transport system permease component